MTFQSIKDPDAVLDYGLTWTPWLAPDETIVSHEVLVDGVTLDSDNRSDDVVVAWLSGGTPGFASVTFRVTTNEGRTDDRTISLRVRER